jgi:hypothetical protein
MGKREAISVLMLSPIYWRLTTQQRVELIKEYCDLYNKVSQDSEQEHL